MFKLNTLSTNYPYPVKFTVIGEDGKQKTHEIKIIFKRFKREQLIELNRNNSNIDIDIDVDLEVATKNKIGKSADQIMEEDLDYLCKFVDGWEGVDIDGDTAFNRDNLRLLLSGVPAISGAITTAFFESAAGGQQRKN